MELVERTVSLEILNERFRQVSAGTGHVVFITGDAGIGKTALINHFIAGIGTSCRLLTGACDSLSTPRPLGPLYDIAGPDFLKTLQTEKDRSAIFAAFLQEIGKAGSPVVLVFEDIHWADEATLDLIKFLSRRAARNKCLFLLTFRDHAVQPGHPLKTLFGELSPGTFSKLALSPFSATTVDRLSKEKGFVSGEKIFSLTGGNPFYVLEILAQYSPGIPDRVKDSILTVFHSKDKNMRSLWELLSILPSRIDFNLVDEIEKDFPEGIATCIASGVIVERSDYLSFKHELYRITIEESLTAYRRRGLHKKMLSIMMQRPESVMNRARILHHAQFAGDAAVVARLAPLEARSAASLGAHLEASKFFGLAVASVPADAPFLAELFHAHAYECYLTNQIAAAIESQNRALGLWREQKATMKVGDAVRFLSRLWWFAGNSGQALIFAKEAIDILENGFPTHERALAYSNFAQLHMLSDDRRQTLEWGMKAIDLAVRMNDKEVHSHALNNVGNVLLRYSDSEEEGEEMLTASLNIALENEFHEHAARAYTNLSTSHVINRNFTKAIPVYEAGLKYCDVHDLKTWTWYMQSEKTKLLIATGQYDEAHELAHIIYSNPSHTSIVRLGAIGSLARLAIRRGDFDNAATLIHEGKELAELTKEAQRIVPVLTAHLEYCFVCKLPVPADEVKNVLETLFPRRNNSWHLSDLVYWSFKCGLRIDEPTIQYRGPLQSELSGDWRDAADQWQKLGCLYEEALALFEGDEEHQKRSLLLLDDLGAPATSEMLRVTLKNKGVLRIPRGARESTRSNAAGLTVRQIDVLKLLQEGLQNKEIADRLFISPKTVDHHISAILSQLDVGTRAKAVVAAIRRGILK